MKILMALLVVIMLNGCVIVPSSSVIPAYEENNLRIVSNPVAPQLAFDLDENNVLLFGLLYNPEVLGRYTVVATGQQIIIFRTLNGVHYLKIDDNRLYMLMLITDTIFEVYNNGLYETSFIWWQTDDKYFVQFENEENIYELVKVN